MLVHHRKHARVGVVALKVRCSEAVTATLSGKVVVGKGKKRKTYTFATVHRVLAANRTVTVVLSLPRRALSALAHHAHESVTFKLSVHNANGTKTVAAKIGALKPGH